MMDVFHVRNVTFLTLYSMLYVWSDAIRNTKDRGMDVTI